MTTRVTPSVKTVQDMYWVVRRHMFCWDATGNDPGCDLCADTIGDRQYCDLLLTIRGAD